MKTPPVRLVLLVLLGAGTILVVAGVAGATWRPAVLGLAALQAALLVAVVVRTRARSAAAPSAEVARSLNRLEERLQALEVRTLVEAQATQRLVDDLRDDLTSPRDA